MKKITFLTFLLISAFGYSQITLFEDDFEGQTDFVIDADINDWMTLDLDGLPTYTGGVDGATYPNVNAVMAYQIFNPSTTTPTPATNDDTGASGETRNFDPHSGQKYAACWAAVPDGTTPANDDWLITPVIRLGTEGNLVSFWVKAMSDTYGPENYTVGIYEGTGDPTGSSDFTLLTIPFNTAPYPDWENVTFDLSALGYNDVDVRIGIHCISADRYMFMVDTFEITTTTLSVEDFDQAHNYVISFADKQVTISSIVDQANYRVISINGQVVLSGNSRAETEVIDLSNLSSGVYIVEVSDGNEQRVQRKKIALQ